MSSRTTFSPFRGAFSIHHLIHVGAGIHIDDLKLLCLAVAVEPHPRVHLQVLEPSTLPSAAMENCSVPDWPANTRGAAVESYFYRLWPPIG